MCDSFGVRIPVLLALLMGWTVLPAQAVDMHGETVRCPKTKYSYLLFAPEGSGPAPAVLLLHGAGEDGSGPMSAWRELAAREKIALIAPDLPRELKFEALAPEVFRCVVDDAGRRVPIDRKRIYLFGNSMGGYLGFDGAMFDSQYFAAAAVHAADIADGYRSILGKAGRKIPLSIYIGDRDQFFPIAHVRETANLLTKAGFPTRLIEIKGHDHNYYAVSERVNADAWEFFRQNKLP